VTKSQALPPASTIYARSGRHQPAPGSDHSEGGGGGGGPHAPSPPPGGGAPVQPAGAGGRPGGATPRPPGGAHDHGFPQRRGGPGRFLNLMGRLAPWAALALVGAALLFAAGAPAAEGASGGNGSATGGALASRATPYDVRLALGPYFFNPSIVRHRGVYLSTARTAHMKRIEKTNWWFNDASICMSTSADFGSVSCRKFDPWQG
jgi:hypothetical protein